MTASGFVGPPPPIDGVWADSQAEARRIYEAAPGEFGYPMQVGQRWIVPRSVRVINAALAAEAAEVNRRYGPMFTTSPGSSRKRARLKPEDRRRIDRTHRQRRAEVEREERTDEMRQAALF